MSLIEACIPVLTCICGYCFFTPLVKRKCTPNHVHTYLECCIYRPQSNTVKIAIVLSKVIIYVG